MYTHGVVSSLMREAILCIGGKKLRQGLRQSMNSLLTMKALILYSTLTLLPACNWFQIPEVPEAESEYYDQIEEDYYLVCGQDMEPTELSAVDLRIQKELEAANEVALDMIYLCEWAESPAGRKYFEDHSVWTSPPGWKGHKWRVPIDTVPNEVEAR
jgi:hypothetical protein